MIKLTRLVSDFLLPKIRDSFMRQFAAVSALEEVEEEAVSEILAAATTMASISAGAALIPGPPGHPGVGGGTPAVARAGSAAAQQHQQNAQNAVGGLPAGWKAKAAETAAALTCSRDIRRKVHGLHGEEKVRAIVYLLRLVPFPLLPMGVAMLHF